MHKVYSPAVLNGEEISCKHCSWKGQARETQKEHLFLTDAIELYCPECTSYLGFVNEEEENLHR
jgi:hypothetical protein